MTTLTPGMEIADGAYILSDLLGSGATASAWSALHFLPDGGVEDVVLKVLLSEGRQDPHKRQMFVEEAHLAALLTHPNIVSVRSIFQWQSIDFLVMERIWGVEFDRLIKHTKNGKKPIPWPLGVKMISLAAEGIHYANTKTSDDGTPLHLVHRDIKPSNLFFTVEGNVKIIDFGIAKTSLSQMKTQTGIVKGTIAYMAPEHLKAEKLDVRADIYALGVVLYEVLTGYRPFAGENMTSVMFSVLTQPPFHPHEFRQDLPRPLCDFVMRTLDKERTIRSPDASTFANELNELLPLEPTIETSPRARKAFFSSLFSDVETAYKERQNEIKRAASLAQPPTDEHPSLPSQIPATSPSPPSSETAVAPSPPQTPLPRTSEAFLTLDFSSSPSRVEIIAKRSPPPAQLPIGHLEAEITPRTEPSPLLAETSVPPLPTIEMDFPLVPPEPPQTPLFTSQASLSSSQTPLFLQKKPSSPSADSLPKVASPSADSLPKVASPSAGSLPKLPSPLEPSSAPGFSEPSPSLPTEAIYSHVTLTEDAPSPTLRQRMTEAHALRALPPSEEPRTPSKWKAFLLLFLLLLLIAGGVSAFFLWLTLRTEGDDGDDPPPTGPPASVRFTSTKAMLIRLPQLKRSCRLEDTTTKACLFQNIPSGTYRVVFLSLDRKKRQEAHYGVIAGRVTSIELRFEP